MPRASDYLVEGYTYHLTHRCHGRQMLLNAACERDPYRDWLREGVKRYGVPVYGYCITRNHVHVIAHAVNRESISRMMQLAAGSTAKAFNLRKNRSDAMWEHPYHCTIIQDGQHLLNCLCYVDLNMVRAGVVSHPSEWKWSGFQELVGERARYRILDVNGLLERLDFSSPDNFGAYYNERIAERIDSDSLQREAHWTEALAVGSEQFVDTVRKEYRSRYVFSAEQLPNGAWHVREEPAAYSVKKAQIFDSKPPK